MCREGGGGWGGGQNVVIFVVDFLHVSDHLKSLEGSNFFLQKINYLENSMEIIFFWKPSLIFTKTGSKLTIVIVFSFCFILFKDSILGTGLTHLAVGSELSFS